jgi:hypothetical protein
MTPAAPLTEWPPQSAEESPTERGHSCPRPRYETNGARTFLSAAPTWDDAGRKIRAPLPARRAQQVCPIVLIPKVTNAQTSSYRGIRQNKNGARTFLSATPIRDGAGWKARAPFQSRRAQQVCPIVPIPRPFRIRSTRAPERQRRDPIPAWASGPGYRYTNPRSPVGARHSENDKRPPPSHRPPRSAIPDR